MHDGFLTALEDEVALRWEELNALFEKFGFVNVEDMPEVEHDDQHGYFYRVRVALSDTEGDSLLDADDRMKLLIKAIGQHQQKIITGGHGYGVFTRSNSIKAPPRTTYLGSAAALEEHLWDMLKSLPRGGKWLFGWNETLHRPEPVTETTHRSVTLPSGRTIDDNWRHVLRAEFKKLYAPFGFINTPPRFTTYSLGEADFGGDFRVPHNDILTFEDSAALFVKAVARKLVQLVDKGLLVSPETRLRKPITKDDNVTVDGMAKQLRPLLRPPSAPDREGKLTMHWTVYSPEHSL